MSSLPRAVPVLKELPFSWSPSLSALAVNARLVGDAITGLLRRSRGMDGMFRIGTFGCSLRIVERGVTKRGEHVSQTGLFGIARFGCRVSRVYRRRTHRTSEVARRAARQRSRFRTGRRPAIKSTPIPYGSSPPYQAADTDGRRNNPSAPARGSPEAMRSGRRQNRRGRTPGRGPVCRLRPRQP